MKKAVIILIFTGFFVVMSVKGQSYRNGIGLVLGGSANNGMTVKHFFGLLGDRNNPAFEGILSTLYHGFLLTGLYENHNPVSLIKKVHGINWYYGGGIHVASFEENPKYCPSLNKYKRATNLGIDVVLGLEYEMQNLFPNHKVPLTVGSDFKPYYDVIGSGCGKNWFLSFSLRYVFGY